MKNLNNIIVAFILSALLFSASAQYNGYDFSIGINGLFTTTAQVFLNPKSSDLIVRNQSTEISNIFNPSIDIRYGLTDDIIIGLGSEYMVGKTNNDNITAIGNNNNTLAVPVADEFKLIPIELTGYYLLPFSTDHFKFLMGGGGGVYIGSQKRTVADAESNTIEKEFSFGIHVVVSMDYLPLPFFSVRAEMKFRDPEMNFTNRYNKSSTTYKGRVIRFAQQTYYSKVNVDGITFIVGAVYHF
ncbi:MAG TPA: hypothetical protein VKA26_04365 [Ignavibacteriaceae bacterium]|nr:hypothetical protein [Ignavibacteriaceae bacterium]